MFVKLNEKLIEKENKLIHEHDVARAAATMTKAGQDEVLFRKPDKRALKIKEGSPAGSLSNLSIATNRTDLTNRSSDSKKSFADMPIEYVSDCMSFDIMDLFDEQKESLSEMGVTLRSDDLSSLFESLYEFNTEKIKISGFPYLLVLESDKRIFVDLLLQKITSFISQKFNVNRKRLIQATKLKLSLPLGQVVKQVEPDFTIFEKVRCSKKHFLAVVECKDTCIDEAVKQGVGYAKAAFIANGDNQTVYGLATNTTSFRLISYNPADESAAEEGGFKLSKQFEYLFFKMEEESRKQHWLDNNTEIVKVIYSILCEKLGL